MSIKLTGSFYVWGIGPLDPSLFSETEMEYLKNLPDITPKVEWIWREMDRVWTELELDNKRDIGGQAVAEFYSHPIWLVNGFFSRVDSASSSHRLAIANHLATNGFRKVADYGGGFGELAVRIATEVPSCSVSIIEPFPTHFGKVRLADFPTVSYTANLVGTYDAVIAQDVLEHIEDPIELAFRLADSVKPGGEIIFANCFYPVILCHLPCTFHMRHTFPLIMRAMGLKHAGSVKDAQHIQVYRRRGKLSLPRARLMERLSRLIGPWINRARS